MFYIFQVCTSQPFVEPDPSKRLWIRISSENLLAKGHLYANVNYNLGRRLYAHIERKGHTVFWLPRD